MLNPFDDFLTQKVILLMTGVPGTVEMRDQISQLIKDGDQGNATVVVEDLMTKSTAPSKNADNLPLAVQYLLDRGFSINLTTQKIDQLIADSFREGIDDSWLGLITLIIDGVGNNNVGKILENRANAAEDFTNRVNERSEKVDVNDPLVQDWIDKIDASNGSLNAAKNSLGDLIDQLTKPPVLTSSTPLDEAIEIAINQDLMLVFNKAVKAGTGNIVMTGSDGDIRVIPVTDTSQVTINGRLVTINPTEDLHPNTTYSVELPKGVFTDSGDRLFAGASDLNFNTIDTLPPELTGTAPLDDAIEVTVDKNISLTFSEKIQAGVGDIILSSDDSTDIRAIAITDSGQVTITGDTLIVNPANDLLNGKGYSVQLAEGVITDLAGNPYAGISDFTTLNFRTLSGAVTTSTNNNPTTSTVTLTTIAEDGGTRLITQAELLGSANDVDGDTLTATGLAIAFGNGTLTANTGGTWDYVPDLNDDTDVSFSYIIRDGKGGTAHGSAFLDITPVNDNPTTGAVTLTAIAEDSGVRRITQAELLSSASDVDGDSLTATGLSISSGSGSLVDNLDGTWGYTPTLGDDTDVSFSYTISDGKGGAALGSAFLDIFPAIDILPPTIGPGQVASYFEALLADGSLNGPLDDTADIFYTVLASDDVGIASFTIVSGDPNNWFSINTAGQLSLTSAGLTSAANDYENLPNEFFLGIVATDAAGNNSPPTIVAVNVVDNFSHEILRYLTTGTDTPIGTIERERFMAYPVGILAPRLPTLQDSDVIDGGGDDGDVLEININGLSGGTVTPTLRNIEIINVLDTGIFGSGTLNLNMSKSDGVRTISLGDVNGTITFDNIKKIVNLHSFNAVNNNTTLTYTDDALSLLDSMSISLYDSSNTSVTINNELIGTLDNIVISSSGSGSGKNDIILEGAALASTQSMIIVGDNDLNLSTIGLNGISKIDAEGSTGNNKLDLANTTNDLVITGGSGDDTIIGGLGNDSISGFSGNDTIIGGEGIDTMTGGAGADTFFFGSRDARLLGALDTITDFVSGVDHIDTDYSGRFANIVAPVTDWAEAYRMANILMDARTYSFVFAHDSVNGWLFVGDGPRDGVNSSIQLTGVTSIVATDIS